MKLPAALLLLAAPALAQDTLIEEGASWRYLDDGSNQGQAWRQPGFDDSSWALGDAQLGYGDGDETTVVSFGGNANDKHITTYFRREFQVPDPSGYFAVRLRVLRDDGVILYLNGQEMVRDNLPAGVVTSQTIASSTVSGSSEDAFFTFFADPAALSAGSNVLAAEIHQRSATSSDISFDLEVAGLTDPVLVRGPYLQFGTTTSAVVRWRSILPTDAQVWYGTAPDQLDQVASDPSVGTDHRVALSGLTPCTRYYYAVGDSAGPQVGGDAEHSFKTSPPAGQREPFRAWVLGDCGTGNAAARRVRDAYYAFEGDTPTDLMLFLGDNAYNDGTDEEYQVGVFGIYDEMLRRTVAWSTRGNHERVPQVYFDIFEFPTNAEAGGAPSATEAYYSFDYANVHFVCLDSFGSDRSVGGPQWLWLRQDLEVAAGSEWIVAFWHHPPYSKGSHDSDTESALVDMRRNFLPLLEAGGVDLVFGGHSHSYERSFLIDRMYVRSGQLRQRHIRDQGNGRIGEDGPYAKAPLPNEGAVYCVAGSSGRLTNAPLDHSVMIENHLEFGSVVLDVDGTRLDVQFLDDVGKVHDTFTMFTFPDEGLTANTTTLPLLRGGVQRLELDAGPAHAGRTYLMLGSSTGFAPGTVAVAGTTLPLVRDGYTERVLGDLNGQGYRNFLGTLDARGRSTAELALPASTLALLGETYYHAYAVFDAGFSSVSFVSNAFPLTFRRGANGLVPKTALPR